MVFSSVAPPRHRRIPGPSQSSSVDPRQRVAVVVDRDRAVRLDTGDFDAGLVRARRAVELARVAGDDAR
jgi:hypothetical protein